MIQQHTLLGQRIRDQRAGPEVKPDLPLDRAELLRSVLDGRRARRRQL